MSYGMPPNEESPLFNSTQQNEQLYAQLAVLQSQVANLSAALSNIPNNSPVVLASKEPKVAMPSKFNGDRSSFRGFMNQVETVFKLQPARYAEDIIKIYFIGSLLEGNALAWFNPLIEKPENYVSHLDSYQAFKAFFKASFSEIDPALSSSNKIRKLVQGSHPVSSYAAEFRLLSCDLNWNEDALISQFCYGLSNKVKNMLGYSPVPATLDEIVNLSIRCDNRLAELRQEYRGPDSRPFIPYAPRPVPTLPTAAPPSDAMEIDSVRRRGPLCKTFLSLAV